VQPGPGRAIALALLWAMLVAVALITRPLLAVDETRYLSVAWEMHARGDWLVPHLNGEPYSHKPPLLFWLILIAWKLVGDSEIAARLMAPLFGLLNLFLTAGLARLMWPGGGGRAVADVAPFILLGSGLWTLFVTFTRFDMMVSAFVLLGAIGLVVAARATFLVGFSLLALALGGGALSKGPVILLYLLPLALAAPYWAPGMSVTRYRPRWGAWYAGVAAAVIAGAAIGRAWAIPAARAGGPAYTEAIFWSQSAGRITESFAHRQPFWWYLPQLPLLLFPWLLWPPAWRAIGALWRGAEPASRFCVLWVLSGLVIFSAVSGKAPHYLLPLFPGFALLLARYLMLQEDRLRAYDTLLPAFLVAALGAVSSAWPSIQAAWPQVPSNWTLPGWTHTTYLLFGVGLGLAAVVTVASHAARHGFDAVRSLMVLPMALIVLAHAVGIAPGVAAFDLAPAGRYLREQETAGRAIATLADYHGEFHFTGRLRQPITELDGKNAKAWLEANANGVVLTRSRALPSVPVAPAYAQPMGGRTLAAWDSATVKAYLSAFIGP
jgi:4-amino-4-deoxy-L-arabinose transferase-like glycosyltransferase